MAIKDNNGGWLSRVARLIRRPALGDPESPPAESESEAVGHSKQSLREMIERKRQNDFVRRLEFDHLRKLRRKGPAANPDVAGRPSFFQSSLPSNLDERAVTLKKIDEIEAQMSKQWWKGQQEQASQHPLPAGAPAQPETAPEPFQKTPSELAVGVEHAPGGPSSELDDQPTQMGWPAPGEGASTAEGDSAPGTPGSSSGAPGESTNQALLGANLLALEPAQVLPDPDTEEAAIRFANGDDVGAEHCLLTALQAEGALAERAEEWAAALFDLYRATGQQDRFDQVAIDYAQRFGRSAPGWFSVPDLLGRPVPAAPAPVNRMLVWHCPVELDLSAVLALQAKCNDPATPWRLNWHGLETITPDAAAALADLFAQWCRQPVTLQLDGADVLEKKLRGYTPSGDRQVAFCWWGLRLDALRILGLQEEFELAALEYCVTYEVSPPSWEVARCVYVPEVKRDLRFAGATAPLSAADAAPFEGDSEPVTRSGPETESATVVELSGDVHGDAAEVLNRFQRGLVGTDRLVISCARLVRVDFSAAGSILNWLAGREADGCQVQFHDVPRLVAAFFRVIGIQEHAQVIVRSR